MVSQEPALAIDRQLHELLKAHTNRFSFVISDMRLPDCPIVFASATFFDVTGYSPEEVLGRNCRFLQGPRTSKRKVMEIRDAVREDRSCQVCLLNYRKNGEAFYNQFSLAPMRDEEKGTVQFYVGIQCDVTAEVKAACRNADDAEAVLDSFCCSTSYPGADSIEQTLAHCTTDQGLHLEHSVKLASDGSGASCMTTDGMPKTDGFRQHSLSRSLRSMSSVSSGGADASIPVSAVDLPSSLLCPLMRIQQSFCLADATLPDCPIVHASAAFLQMTGYPREEVVGRNCRFLQGPATDPAEVAKIREAMSADPPQPVTVTLLNYKYDGTPFMNALHVAPIRGAQGKVHFYAGVQLDVGMPVNQMNGLSGSGQGDLPSRARLQHNSCVASVRVAVRSLSRQGLRRSADFQRLPQ